MSLELGMTWPQYLRAECRLRMDRVIHLSRREADMLSVLLMRRPEPVPVGDVIEALWHPDREPDCVEDCVYHIAERLRGALGRDIVRARPGFGYEVVC